MAPDPSLSTCDDVDVGLDSAICCALLSCLVLFVFGVDLHTAAAAAAANEISREDENVTTVRLVFVPRQKSVQRINRKLHERQREEHPHRPRRTSESPWKQKDSRKNNISGAFGSGSGTWPEIGLEREAVPFRKGPPGGGRDLFGRMHMLLLFSSDEKGSDPIRRLDDELSGDRRLSDSGSGKGSKSYAAGSRDIVITLYCNKKSKMMHRLCSPSAAADTLKDGDALANRQYICLTLISCMKAIKRLDVLIPQGKLMEGCERMTTQMDRRPVHLFRFARSTLLHKKKKEKKKNNNNDHIYTDNDNNSCATATAAAADTAYRRRTPLTPQPAAH
ncbi:hypothetical protein F2P81_023042 [Scophthalmus maximus]|uniref:Uncharacterized protein n=1 Tax=Scophthalmus maximus TaxID=52904 RepID=A0A6A4RY24_SCOMX|nr:hypothetical protein F2P81_023042 [Scophthalmus maximus]